MGALDDDVAPCLPAVRALLRDGGQPTRCRRSGVCLGASAAGGRQRRRDRRNPGRPGDRRAAGRQAGGAPRRSAVRSAADHAGRHPVALRRGRRVLPPGAIQLASSPGLRAAGVPARPAGLGHPVPHRDHAGDRAGLGGRATRPSSADYDLEAIVERATRSTTTSSRCGSRSPPRSPTSCATRRGTGAARRADVERPRRSPTRPRSAPRSPPRPPRRAAVLPMPGAAPPRAMTEHRHALSPRRSAAAPRGWPGCRSPTAQRPRELLAAPPLRWWDREPAAPVDDAAAAVIAALGRTADPDARWLRSADARGPGGGAELRGGAGGEQRAARPAAAAARRVSPRWPSTCCAHPADWQVPERRYDLGRRAARLAAAVGADADAPGDRHRRRAGDASRGPAAVAALRPRTGASWSRSPAATSPASSTSRRSPRRSPIWPGTCCRPRSRSPPPSCRPDAAPCRLAIIAMGKTGGRELNYVSDVDVVFVAEPGARRRRRRTPADALRPRRPSPAATMRLCRAGRLGGRRRTASRGQGRAAGAHARQPRGVLPALGEHLGVPGAAQGAAGRRRPRARRAVRASRSRRWCGRPPSVRTSSPTCGRCVAGWSTTSRRGRRARDQARARRAARRRVRRAAAAARARPR